jgi:cytidine deaminase
MKKLIQAAEEARTKAYAPYSGFKVGAAILGDDDLIYTGANIENASYGLAICAERVALFKAVSSGIRCFKALAVIADLDNPVSPCGACRQVLVEFAPEMTVYLANTKGKIVETTVAKLLPHAFTPSQLEEKHNE